MRSVQRGMIATIIFSIIALSMAMAKIIRTPEPEQIVTAQELQGVKQELEAKLKAKPTIVTTMARPSPVRSSNDRPPDMASRAVQIQILQALAQSKRDIARLENEIRRLTAVHERAPE